jgi:hypothetical protein
MPLHGQLKRPYPRLEVLRGYNPNEPHTLTQSHPAFDVGGNNEPVISSGMIVYLAWDATNSRYGWKLGCAAGYTPYIALQDWDRSQTAGLGQFGYDPDVMEAGKLTGLSCAGQFEVQTAFYKTEVATYKMDDKLTYCTGQDAGWVELADSGDPIVGFITRPRGEGYPNDLDRINSNVVNKSAITWTTYYDENPAI